MYEYQRIGIGISVFVSNAQKNTTTMTDCIRCAHKTNDILTSVSN